MSFILVSIFASFANADNRFSHLMKSQEGDSVGAGNTADLDESVGLSSLWDDVTDGVSKGADLLEDTGSAIVDTAEDVWDWLSEEQAAAFNEQSVGHEHGGYQIHNLQASEGGTSCMADYGPITTNTECEAAANALGYVYNGEALSTDHSAPRNRLPYCWFGFEKSLVNFNPTGDFGSNVKNSPARLVCKTLGLPSGNGQKRKAVGTCSWSSCPTSHGPTVCNQKAQCVCARGYHTLDEKTCVPRDGPCKGKLMTTKGTCSISGCNSNRGKTVCSMGACQCLHGWWSLDGEKCDQQCAPGSGAPAGHGKKKTPVGTCKYTSCSGSYGPTICNQEKKCVCAREYHTLDGKTCVPNDGPCKDKPIATDGTCSLFKCKGNTVCRAGACICRPGFFTTPDRSESCASTCPSPSGEVEPKVTLNTYSLLLNEFEYFVFYGLALVGLVTILAFLRFAFQNNEYKTAVDEMSKLEELSAEI